jgi:hypothetical protein
MIVFDLMMVLMMVFCLSRVITVKKGIALSSISRWARGCTMALPQPIEPKGFCLSVHPKARSLAFELFDSFVTRRGKAT